MMNKEREMKKTYGDFMAELYSIPTHGFQAHYAVGGLMALIAGVAADLPAKKQAEILRDIASVARGAAKVESK
jgi:hypothetical protein